MQARIVHGESGHTSRTIEGVFRSADHSGPYALLGRDLGGLKAWSGRRIEGKEGAVDHAGEAMQHARTAYLRRVEALCGERRVQLKTLRRQVLGLLADSAAPLTAYALIDELARLQGRGVAPPTV